MSLSEATELERVPLSETQQRILFVDDDPDTLTLIHAVLTRAGFAVTSVSSLLQARQALTQHRYQLVLTDLYLGDQSLGYEVAEIARAMSPPLPVILVTGHPSFSNAAEALRSRVREMLVKPVDGEKLVIACRRAIDDAEIRRRAAELESQNRLLAELLPRAIEAKDPMTKGHSERVVRYAEALARRCGVGDADRESLRMAALLHDIGKIGVPEEILRKAGPLDAEERGLVQRHPEVGYDILEPIANCDVREWVYQHHERWDGGGYPNGLVGAQVELPGRILILAEVYDALAEARSYKPAWPIAKISGFFRHEAGRHFDPDLAHLVADGLERYGKPFFAPQPGLLF